MARSGSSLGLLENPGGVAFNTETAKECDTPVIVEEKDHGRGLMERKNTLGRQKEAMILISFYSNDILCL